jgi:phosphatidylinositol-3-phosphatase
MRKITALYLFLLLMAACVPTRTIITTTPSPNPTVESTITPSATQTATSTLTPTIGNTTAIPNFDHILLIVLENTDYSVAMNSSRMPYFAWLVQNNVFLKNYFGITRPSLPNYLALISGSTQGVARDCTDCYVNAPNLADELDQAGKSWKAYMESMPSSCYIGNAYPYAQKHNPFIYFDSVRLNTTVCDRSVVPMTELSADLSANTLPDFSFIMPDLCNSGHD